MLPPSRGGNVELVVLDDDPDSGALTALFTALRGGKALQPHPIAPSELATTAEVDIVSLLEAEVRSGGRWVVRAILSSDTILVAPILRVAAAGRTVVDVSLTLAPDGILVGSAPVPGGHLPLFAQLYCTIDGVEIKTQAIPVNQPDHLLRAQLDPDTARQLAAITPDKTSFAERDAVLQDLLEIAWQEFEDETQPIIEPPKPRREKREVRTDDEASALDPLDLVYRATTGASSLLSSHQGSAMPDVLSVFERLVWGTPERTAEAFDDRIGIEDDQNDDTHSGGRPLATSMRISDAGESQKAADSETAASVRLKLDDWICRLDGDDILSHANPPAAAFRCAHVILGISQAARRARWISARDAADFAIRTAACFLSRGRISALITRINARCETGLLRESFRTYIQSGRLLAAFITALTADEPTSIGEAIQRGSILARLRATPVLVAEIDENDLEALSAGSTDAADRIRRFSRVSEIATASDDLDRMLSQRRAGLMRKVGSGGTQRRPDVFWSSAEGWILDQATTTVVTSSVGWITAAGDPDVRRKAELVMHAWLGLQARPHYAAQAVAG